MMCFRHNRFVRAGDCPLCTKDALKNEQNERDIASLEREIKAPIVLWEGHGTISPSKN